jgi:hypothetical protein
MDEGRIEWTSPADVTGGCHRGTSAGEISHGRTLKDTERYKKIQRDTERHGKI